MKNSKTKPKSFKGYTGIVVLSLFIGIVMAIITESLAWSLGGAAVFFVMGIIGLIAKELNLQSQ